MTYTALLAGTGFWAEQHVKAYGQCARVALAGVVGHSNRARLDELAGQYGIPYRGMDLAAAVAAVQPDIVDVSTSPRYRLEAVRACLAPCVKLINLEKPMALEPEEAYAIAALCREHGKLLTVNHQKKFLRTWAKAREIIAAGSLGQMRFYRATCKGNMLEQGTHLFDMVQFFHGAPIAWVMGQVADLEGFDKPKTPAPDSGTAVIGFADGVHALMTFGNIGWDVPGETGKWFHMGIEAYGKAGHLAISLNQTLAVTTYADGRTVSEPSVWDDQLMAAQAAHMDAAAACIDNPAAGHLSDLEHSLQSFDAVMAVYAAATEGKVELPRRFDNGVLERLRARRTQAGV